MTREEKIEKLRSAAHGLLLLATTYGRAVEIAGLLSEQAIDGIISDILELEAASAAIAIRRKADGYAS